MTDPKAGFAVMAGTEIDVLTVTDNEWQTMLVALSRAGVQTACRDRNCDCVANAFAQYLPGAVIVPVLVSRINHS